MRHSFLVFIYIFIAIVSFIVPDTQYSADGIWTLEVLLIVSVTIFMLYKEPILAIKAVFFRPLFLFILAYIIVFFQSPIDFILGYVDGYLRIGDHQLMIVSVKYALLGLLAFLIGYVIEADKIKAHRKGGFSVSVVSPKPFAFFSSLLIVLLLVLVPRSVLMGGYSNDMLTNASIYNYLSSWVNTILISYIVIYTVNAKQTGEQVGADIKSFIKSIGWWQNINVIVYTIIILNIGDRGPLIVLAFSYYLSYIVICKKKLSNTKISVALISAIMITSILGDTKQFRDNNSIWERLISVLDSRSYQEKESFFPGTSQLAGSYCCLPLAIQMQKNTGEYDFGKNQVSGITSAIPFIGRIMKLPESTSSRISRFALGDNFDYGLGTSCISDLFLDGGLFFILIGMFLWGMVLRKFEENIFLDGCSSFFSFCMGFYFLVHVVYIPRSTILSPFKYGLWMYVIILLYMTLRKKVTR